MQCPDCNALDARMERYEQQVGEVQGDAWTVAELVRTDLDKQACPDHFMRVAVESVVKHLAARQPGVQMPVQQSYSPAVVPYRRAHALLGDAYNAGTQGVGFGDQAEALFDAMMATPTAQGIDLGQFMDFIGFAIMQALSLPETDPRRDYIRKGDELLTMIGQRDAAPGVSHG